jgi:ATP-dependent Clp protease, protease subunit
MKKRFHIFNDAPPKNPSEVTKPWFSIRNEADKSKPVEVLIYDTIGKEHDWWTGEESGVGAQDFINQVKAALPDDAREIVIGINSRGGNVWDGLAIYNFLSALKNRVVTRIDGLAASIASVIALAGKEVRMPVTAQFMIHDPATVAVGGEKEMHQAVQALQSSKKTIMAAYRKKTGRADAEISAKMTDETWFSGQEAKDFGFVDTLTDAQPVFNSMDLSGFKCVPEAIRKIMNSAPKSVAKPKEEVMNREQIIAMLKEHGIQVANDATLEQLQAELKKALTAKAPTPPPAPAPAPAPTAAEARLAAMEARYESERKARITREIDNAVSERRITAQQRDSWLALATVNEEVLNQIKAIPPQLPPEGVTGPVELVSDSLYDVAKHLTKMRAGVDKTRLMRKNEDRLVAAWHDPKVFEIRNEGTNTVDASLKQDVLLDQALKAFSRVLTPLSLFSTKFQSTPLRGTNKIQVPYIALESAASTAWNAANGYVAGDTVSDNRELEINRRYYQAIRWTAEELARQPFLMLAEHMAIKGEKLAYDTWLDILSVVTIANFATAAYTGAAAAFDSDDGIDLETAATVAEWPEGGRILFLNTAFDNALKKDNAVKLALNIGGTEVLRQGKLPNLFGFTYANNSKVPANAESLAGFIAWKSAILIGSAPIPPTQEEVDAGLRYTVLTDPDTGISMESKRFGQPQMNRAFWTIEQNYGYAKGEGAALQRIATA